MSDKFVVYPWFYEIDQDGDQTARLTTSPLAKVIDDLEVAKESARCYCGHDGVEVVLVIKIQPFAAPELIGLVGELSGNLAMDGYDLAHSVKKVLKHAIAWVSSQYRIVEGAEVPY